MDLSKDKDITECIYDDGYNHNDFYKCDYYKNSHCNKFNKLLEIHSIGGVNTGYNKCKECMEFKGDKQNES